VYVRGTISAAHRRRLIVARVAFVVPGTQVYLPDLGIDLRESFPASPDPRVVFRPATQAVLIWALLQQTDGLTGGRTLARRLLYSAMTLSRAMDEIRAAGLAVDASSGRERTIRWVGSRRDVWERAREHLADPVQSRHLVRTDGTVPAGPAAGLTALSMQTLIDGPSERVHAVGHEAWIALQRGGTIEMVPHREPSVIEIEVWSYDPMLTAVGGHSGRVDPLSLYLSLRADPDERVQGALKEMMGEIEW
jgi:biotin operon repressor